MNDTQILNGQDERFLAGLLRMLNGTSDQFRALNRLSAGACQPAALPVIIFSNRDEFEELRNNFQREN